MNTVFLQIGSQDNNEREFPLPKEAFEVRGPPIDGIVINRIEVISSLLKR
jgi:hypothetical protein